MVTAVEEGLRKGVNAREDKDIQNIKSSENIECPVILPTYLPLRFLTDFAPLYQPFVRHFMFLNISAITT